MNNRAIRNKEKAINHIEQMDKDYSLLITASKNNSVIYTDDNIYNKIDIIVDNVSITDAVKKYKDDGILCVLNFASYKRPGGGFLNGAIAQEESICHESTLYNVISSRKFISYYENNKKDTNKGLYKNKAIYSPNIVFTNCGKMVNVITCAAPNLSAFNGLKYEANIAIMDRIKFILNIAEKNNETELILGAFGCGIFKNDPEFVAYTFKHILHSNNYHFKKVIFAIPGGINYDIFKKILE